MGNSHVPGLTENKLYKIKNDTDAQQRRSVLDELESELSNGIGIAM